MSYSRDYNKVLKYAASDTSKQLLKAVADDSAEQTPHLALADHLEETGESPIASKLIRRQYGAGEYAGQPHSGWFGIHQLSYPDNTPADSEPLHEDDNFTYHLGHTSQAYSTKYSPMWIVHAVSKHPDTHGRGYSFDFNYKDAHEISQLFPAAEKYIDSSEHPDWGMIARENEGRKFRLRNSHIVPYSHE